MIAALNDRSTRVDANSILADLYSSTWLIKNEPPFAKDRESKKKALGHLIEGLTASRDQNAVEYTLLLFLKVSDVGEIDLSIPEAGVRIRLKIIPNGGYSSGSGAINIRGNLPKTWQWTDEIKHVVPAVQNWMRDQLAK